MKNPIFYMYGAAAAGDDSCKLLSFRNGETAAITRDAIYSQVRALPDRAKVEPRVCPDGATQAGHDEWSKGQMVGLMIAANSGRVLGALGHPQGKGVVPGKVHGDHKTQEEDVGSIWLCAQAGLNIGNQSQLFNATIARRWGMAADKGTMTVQDVDYTSTNNPSDWGDAWSLPGELARTFKHAQKGMLKYPAVLVWVAGPNAGAVGRPGGSMARTLSLRAQKNYPFLRDGVKAAMRAGLDSMADKGVTVAILAGVSTGIYAGPHKKQINEEFPTIVDELLCEPVGPHGELRGCYFAKVIYPMLPARAARAGAGAGAVAGPPLCNKECGRVRAMGRQANGKFWKTCCKACGTGHGHNGSCAGGAAGPPLCNKGCGRVCATGKQANGKFWKTCCKACGTGHGHNGSCAGVLLGGAR